jgi:guanine deaminase
MHEDFLQRAIDLAVNNAITGQGGPFGAIVVKNNQVVSTAANCVTHTLDPTAHAEITAIRMACKKLNDFQLRDCILYTSCEPCPMCLGAIYWARMEKVYFGCTRHEAAAANFDDSFIYDEIAVPPSERKIAMLHLDLPNARQPFDLWMKNSLKVSY